MVSHHQPKQYGKESLDRMLQEICSNLHSCNVSLHLLVTRPCCAPRKGVVPAFSLQYCSGSLQATLVGNLCLSLLCRRGATPEDDDSDDSEGWGGDGGMGPGNGPGTGAAVGGVAAAQAAAVAAAGAPIPPKTVVEAILAWRMPLSAEEKARADVSWARVGVS